jgi:serine/threonine-protein kinase
MVAEAGELERRLRDYRLFEVVESGTHTLVYRARRPGDDRSVLLKTLKPGLVPNADLRAAFRRERRLLAEADHPVLPPVIEVIDDDELLALVYLDHRGHRLKVVLERSERLPTASALAIAIELCGPLAALHRHGQAHGALRPELVELTEAGAVVLHGGLGAHAAAEGDDLQRLPEHMAPEQILGDAPDAATDIFLLGALLYRMIAGRAPFSSVQGSVSQSIRHAEAVSLRSLDEDMAPAIDQLVMRCLKKRPEDRHPDVASLASSLSQALAAEQSVPSWVLVTKALARAGLAEELAPPRERAPLARRTFRAPRWLRRARVPAAIGIGLLFSAALGYQLWSDRDQSTHDASRAVPRRAELRVLAHPWAEVHIDGKLVDVTPIGLPIVLSPGSHEVVFKHPNAPDERRTIEISEGQTLMLDVEMRLQLPDAAAPDEAVTQEEDDTP